MTAIRTGVLLAFVILMFTAPIALATDGRDANLEARVSALERHGRTNTIGGGAAFLYGAFCALWAQNTGRRPWTWFFLGLFFSVITVIVLLNKNAEDRKRIQATTVAT